MALLGAHACLPRGIPAASLKPRLQQHAGCGVGASSAGNTRGLIEATQRRLVNTGSKGSSAGNTRGLIEALRNSAVCKRKSWSSAGNTRGLIEAGNKNGQSYFQELVFRGEYPRPH